MVSQPLVRFDRARFPDSDGDPMLETESRLQQLTDPRHACRALLASRLDVFVGGNHFLYYDADAPERSVAPGVYAAFGVAERGRECYLAFAERVFPQLVIEALYAAQGVEAYYVCDPRPGV